VDTTASFSDPGIYVLQLSAHDGELSASDDISITVVNSASPLPPAQQHQIPGLIESEDYKAGGEGVGYHDTTAGNSGGAYRSDDVDIQATSDDRGGYHISQVVRGEWLAYDVVVAQDGEYDITARVASGSIQTKTFHLEMDGQDVTGPASFDYSSGWHAWQDFTVGNIRLTAGQHELRLFFDTGSYRINYLDMVASNQPPAATIISP
jgi:hypothetical protein